MLLSIRINFNFWQNMKYYLVGGIVYEETKEIEESAPDELWEEYWVEHYAV